LYSTVNRRRVAFAATSTSGAAKAFSVTLIGLRSLLALDIKLQGGHCLTHVGREGAARKLGRKAGAVLVVLYVVYVAVNLTQMWR